MTRTLFLKKLFLSVLAGSLAAQPLLAGAAGTQFTYGGDTRVSKTVLPQGQTYQYAYDHAGQPLTYALPNPQGVGAGSSVQYDWDGQGALQALTDPRGLTTNYAVTGYGDVAAVASPDTGSTSYTFNEAGLPTSRTDARGTATFGWDAAGRLTNAGFADAPAAFSYDTAQAGRLSLMQDASGTTSFTYTAQGLLSSRTQVTEGPTTGSAGATLVVQHAYDAAGRLSQTTYPSGRVVGFSYDGDQVASITVDGTTAISAVQYVPFGPPKSWQMGSAGSYTRTYNTAGQITGYTYENGQRTLTWDDSNRLTGVLNPGGVQWTYAYDNLDRVTSATEGAQGVRGFTLDASGNRQATTINGTAYSYSVDAGSNRLTSSTAPAAASSYQYDGFGQMVSDGTRLFTWTQAGYLSSATVGAYQTLYAYNGLGQRVKKLTGAGSATAARHYVYAEDGVSLLGEYSQPSAAAPVSALYEVVYLEGIPVLALAGGQVYFIQADHLNAPRTIKNSAGAVVWKWESDAFGNGAANQNPGGVALFEFNLRFPGQQFDAETGLHYNNARYYDPLTGRYISSDPIGLAGGINTYGYAGQAPTGFSDPSGYLFMLAPLVPVLVEAAPYALTAISFGLRAWQMSKYYRVAAVLAAGPLEVAMAPLDEVSVPLVGVSKSVFGPMCEVVEGIGGSHRAVRAVIKGTGAHSNHIPAKAAVPGVPIADGPAIAMSAVAHRETLSYGGGRVATEYRAVQRELVSSGRYREAVSMDISDIRGKWGPLYESEIQQMLKYMGDK